MHLKVTFIFQILVNTTMCYYSMFFNIRSINKIYKSYHSMCICDVVLDNICNSRYEIKLYYLNKSLKIILKNIIHNGKSSYDYLNN